MPSAISVVPADDFLGCHNRNSLVDTNNLLIVHEPRIDRLALLPGAYLAPEGESLVTAGIEVKITVCGRAWVCQKQY